MAALAASGHAQAQGFQSASRTTPAAVASGVAPVSPPAAVNPAAPMNPLPQAVSAAPDAPVPAPAPVATLAANTGAFGSGSFSSVSGGSAPVVPAVEPESGGFGAGSAGSFEMAEKVVVDKTKRTLYLMRRGRVIKQYPIKLGLNPYGHKQREGDFRTPEGKYELVARNPRSEFFLSIKISYPNREDAAVANESGFPPGGLIMIHGQPNVPKRPPEHYATRDWTDGCIALSNADMVDVWMRTTVGIPIEIKP